MIKKQCILCSADSGNMSKCRACNTAHNDRNQRRRLDRKDAGLCTDCGGSPPSGNRLCDKCRERNYANKKRMYKKRNLAGQCANCDGVRIANRRLCGDCAKNARNYKVQRSLKLISSGLCTLCGKTPHMPNLKDVDQITKLCQRCHLRQKAGQGVGSTRHWKTLLLILERQNWICPYSGDKIILGDNDSVDHILPISKYPNKKFDITNIQWTTQAMNMMKSDFLDSEFLSEIEKVAKHLGDNLHVRSISKTHPPQTRESKLYHRLNQPNV